MNRKKVFVYDISKGFSRLIKKNFEKEFEIVTCTVKKRIIDNDLSDVDFALIIINDYDDVINFIWIRSKIRIVFLGINIEIDGNLEDSENIIPLDLSQKKTDMINYIKQNFKALSQVEL